MRFVVDKKEEVGIFHHLFANVGFHGVTKLDVEDPVDQRIPQAITQAYDLDEELRSGGFLRR